MFACQVDDVENDLIISDDEQVHCGQAADEVESVQKSLQVYLPSAPKSFSVMLLQRKQIWCLIEVLWWLKGNDETVGVNLTTAIIDRPCPLQSHMSLLVCLYCTICV